MTVRWWIAGGVALGLAAVGLVLTVTPVGTLVFNGPPVATGIAAELMCGGVFVSGRDPDDVLTNDINTLNPLLRHAKVTVDRDNGTVTASLPLAERTALFRPGLGCTLIGAGGKEALIAQARGITGMEQHDRPQPWPTGDAVTPHESPALKAALDKAFSEAGGIDTRAIIVVHKGQIVAERYAAGYNKDTRLLGWSMSKSVTAALIGSLVMNGALSLDTPPPMPDWQQSIDAHKSITLRQLLAMTSGLKFVETYDPGDDATTMLYRRDDMAGYAAGLDVIHPPGSVWSYSSGTANILSKIAVNATGGTLAGVYNFARTHLFEPAGMTSAVFEPDGSGTPVGSSYLYMTARDWARFGQLYLANGTMGWQRILSEDWIATTRTPARVKDGKSVPYDGQFWLNSNGDPDTPLTLPHCPPDLYSAEGHNGQIVAIVPSAQAVIVRLGWNTGSDFDEDRHLAAILAALATPG